MFWKEDRNIVVALEIGSTKIAAAVGEIRPDGSLALLGVGEEPSSKVRKCEIVELDVALRCVQDALSDAERKTDVMVNEVYLAISGAHIRSANVRHSVTVNNEEDEISGEDLEQVREMSTKTAVPPDYSLIHDILQQYTLDDGTTTLNPVGLAAKKLQADYHLVYGSTSRLLTSIRCVKELSIDVTNFALSSYATAQAVLSSGQKELGAVVVNLGGGVTDYIVYMNGMVVHSGVLGVGGEHLTNDIVAGLKIPYAKAEELKKTEGCVVLKADQKHDRITLPGMYNFEEKQIYRESLVAIMQARQMETLEIVLADLQAQPFWEHFAGTVYFTGGASMINGLLELAEEVFPCTVELAQQFPFDGDQNYARRPDLSTVLGLLQYARQVELEAAPVRGWEKMRQSFKKVLAGLKLF